MRKVCYIAGPILHGDLRRNIHRGCEAGVALMRAGLSVIVPHLSCFMGQLYHGDGCIPQYTVSDFTADDWYAMDLGLVAVSHALLRLPGISTGADLEAAKARECDIPVFVRVEDVIEWARWSAKEVTP